MSSGIRVVHTCETCQGRALTLATPPAGGTSPNVELALATLLGEEEARHRDVPVVVLRAGQRSDAAWLAPAVAWLARNGRRPIIRTAVVLPRPVLHSARQACATIILELAHPRLELQRALLGPQADPLPALLLQAQHLRTLGIPVAAHLGPLLPTLQDRDPGAEALLAHIRAASVEDLHLGVGQLSPGRFSALTDLLSWGEAASLLRAFALPMDNPAPATSARLQPSSALALLHHWRRVAQAKGLRVDACGCFAQCHLDTTPRGFVSLRAPELFPSAG